ncbi:hypothetical protein TTHERM_00865330 (macronuclear) [Tetrahymena thermophila SB210]|uniref:Uncharacterized protein n=1 Tax=Tetrahymena thermophila (strain SB210) TaxID=312017 RepID=Q24FD0_TETTS|nr:hypothetical protein TTHERM_00865330 [Tetrahymena thermophila SB210]EAS06528.1 hypothetical protein TTHERM_00865330 [Tetrahymena thermophila SB210]|eukprot:XP_001026773.1 hypothetical protein TTHERM_00865330 [Tetrahymena thermophila SB210]
MAEKLSLTFIPSHINLTYGSIDQKRLLNKYKIGDRKNQRMDGGTNKIIMIKEYENQQIN